MGFNINACVVGASAPIPNLPKRRRTSSACIFIFQRALVLSVDEKPSIQALSRPLATIKPLATPPLRGRRLCPFHRCG
jgi:hypothetical protein